MPLAQFAVWLDATAPSLAIKDSPLAIPLIQSVHILAVALVISGAVLLVLRAWDLAGTDWPLQRWSAPLLARLRWAVAVLALTGALLVLAEPTRALTNVAFQLKIALLVPGAGAVLWLRRRLAHPVAARASARTGTTLVLALSVALVGLGRWIAYV